MTTPVRTKLYAVDGRLYANRSTVVPRVAETTTLAKPVAVIVFPGSVVAAVAPAGGVGGAGGFGEGGGALTVP